MESTWEWGINCKRNCKSNWRVGELQYNQVGDGIVVEWSKMMKYPQLSWLARWMLNQPSGRSGHPPFFLINIPPCFQFLQRKSFSWRIPECRQSWQRTWVSSFMDAQALGVWNNSLLPSITRTRMRTDSRASMNSSSKGHPTWVRSRKCSLPPFQFFAQKFQTS